jgi:two-component system, response regulator
MTGYHEVEILLVEDNDQDAEMTLRALKKQNLANNVHRVEDGQQALNFLFAMGPYSDRNINNGPRVVLLDLKLPKVDGLEILRRVKADERTRMIPVVVMTSSKEDRDMVESYKLGVNSYVAKPVEFEKFLEAVQQFGLYWLLVNRIPR